MSERYFAVCGRPSHSGGMLQVPETLAERASQDLGAVDNNRIGQLQETIAAVARRWSPTPHSVLPPGKEPRGLAFLTNSPYDALVEVSIKAPQSPRVPLRISPASARNEAS
jgi:hypothetical protein